MVNKSLGLSISHVGKNFIHFLLEVIKNSVVNRNGSISFSCEFQSTSDGPKAELVVEEYI
jgi:hypothetical protein